LRGLFFPAQNVRARIAPQRQAIFAAIARKRRTKNVAEFEAQSSTNDGIEANLALRQNKWLGEQPRIAVGAGLQSQETALAETRQRHAPARIFLLLCKLVPAG
jgi:hypothetical protein